MATDAERDVFDRPVRMGGKTNRQLKEEEAREPSWGELRAYLLTLSVPELVELLNEYGDQTLMLIAFREGDL